MRTFRRGAAMTLALSGLLMFPASAQASGMGTATTTTLIAILVVIVLFLVLREFMCWYWKQNEMIGLLREMRNLLMQSPALFPHGLPAATAVEPPTMEQIIQDLKSASADAREAAICQLGLMGSKAKAALPALELAKADESRQVRARAAWAIEQIRRAKD